MPPPAPSRPAGPGSWREAAGFLSRNICVAEKNTNTANTSASAAPLSTANTPRLATMAPSTMPGASSLTMSQRTAPFLWCARTLLTEVKMMVAMEVAMAIFTASPGATPRAPRMADRKGTMIMPPPMPSRPARKPVASPSKASSTISMGSMGMAGGARKDGRRRRPVGNEMAGKPLSGWRRQL